MSLTARCPFCEAVHPVKEIPIGEQLDCPCGALAVFCAPNTEPETSVRLAEIGLSDTKADIRDETLSIVWARGWSPRFSSRPCLTGDIHVGRVAVQRTGEGLCQRGWGRFLWTWF